MKKSKKISLYFKSLILIILTVALILFCRLILKPNSTINILNTNQSNLNEPSSNNNDSEYGNTLNANQNSAIPNTKTAIIAETAKIDVPFTSQAPLGVWDALHEDACEEASLLMINHYLSKTQFDSKQSADLEIKNMIDYENQVGFTPSVTLEELNQIASNNLDKTNGIVKTNVSIDDIKKELSDGHPVIVGAAGKLLLNPNFKNGGPNYHMLVITGYDQTGFITNDPGTRLGENYHYDFEILFNAIHNFDAKNINEGAKSYLVFD
ncbi:MAG: C39 family peptidase [bacterium]